MVVSKLAATIFWSMPSAVNWGMRVSSLCVMVVPKRDGEEPLGVTALTGLSSYV